MRITADHRVRAACFATFLSCFACGQTVAVSRNDLPRLAAYREARVATIGSHRITPAHRPEVALRMRSGETVVTRLEDLTLEGDGSLTLRAKGEVHLRPEQVETIELRLTDPPVRRYGAIGVMAGGPMVLGGLQLQVFPLPWLALDAGGMAIRDGAWGYLGFRVRPFEPVPGLRPFLGAFVANAQTSEEGDEEGTDPPSLASFGGRAGLDVAFSPHSLCSFEADLIHPTIADDRDWLFGLPGHDILWGGVSCGYTF